MSAKSKSQRHLMGYAYSVKKAGKDSKKYKDSSKTIKDLVDSMTLKQLDDFASTKEKGLPKKVKKKTNESFGDDNNKKQYQKGQKILKKQKEYNKNYLAPYFKLKNDLLKNQKQAPTLKKGTKNEFVGLVQVMIKFLNVNNSINIDNIFNDSLENDVKKLQQKLDINPSGIVDDITWDRMIGADINVKESIKPLNHLKRFEDFNVILEQNNIQYKTIGYKFDMFGTYRVDIKTVNPKTSEILISVGGDGDNLKTAYSIASKKFTIKSKELKIDTTLPKIEELKNNN